jgi:hypothetical protein
MSYILEVRGSDVMPQGGATPEELYGAGVWGPAIYGAANRSGLSDEAASTFESRDAAFALSVVLIFLSPSLETRIRELP